MPEFAATVFRGILLGLSITAPIGPTNIEIIRRGSKEGWRAAASFCLGTMLALVLYLLLVVFGFSLFVESTLVNTLLTVTGVLVLAYLAFNSFREFLNPTWVVQADKPGSNQHFVPGVALTISNPAVLLFWTGIMGADLAASQASVGQGLALSLGILIGVGLFFTLLTHLIHFGRRFLRQQYLRYVSLAAGFLLLWFCLKFAYDLISTYAPG